MKEVILMEIITNRLILRKWAISDSKSMYKYAKDPSVGPIAGWPAHKSMDESKKVIECFIKECPYCFAICLKDDINHPIGCIELKKAPCDLTEKLDESELGYWLGKPFWGNGYMVEAATALINYGFNDLKLNAIWVGHYEGNYKSKRVIEKLGFLYHHTTNDLEVPLLTDISLTISPLLLYLKYSKLLNP